MRNKYRFIDLFTLQLRGTLLKYRSKIKEAFRNIARANLLNEILDSLSSVLCFISTVT